MPVRHPRPVRSARGRRPRWTAATGAVLLALALPVAPALAPAAAAAVPLSSLTLVGSLQSELGCAQDWDPSCTTTDLTLAADGSAAREFTVPAGSYEFKVAANHTWDVSWGADGVEGGANLPLHLDAPARLRFAIDATTHVPTVGVVPQSDAVTAADRALAGDSLRSGLTRERFYFVMTDRFDNADRSNDTGGYVPGPRQEARLATGYDPQDKGFYHGGDLKGLMRRLDYIKGMGTTAIWLTPSFKNRPVQGSGADVSAGYHGYWITDFTQIDPHLGTNAELKQLIDAAHGKGMKVFFDIITNHTADVIDYRQGQYTYIPKSAQPYKDAQGTVFDDHDYAAGSTFPTLDENSFPYTPYFRTAADATVKVPAWLNDPLKYHNRGNAAFDGSEGDRYGDFSGLDDLFTEQPAVRDGMIDIYSFWAKFGIDGFRIDTVKHVNLEFWQKFAPAMEQAAASVGKKNFFQFGEVYDADPAAMSVYTTAGKLPATLDFGFQAKATGFGLGQPTRDLAGLYANDDYYTDADSNAYELPTFLGNHDMGRIGYFLQNGGYSGQALLQRDLLTQQLMFLTRGQPVTYYGDEQGFTGDGGDKDARQDMFGSQVASYNDDTLIGTSATTATPRFDPKHPVYRALTTLSALRTRYPALADGAQLPRYSSDQAGIFAVSRIAPREQVEYVVVANNATTTKSATLPTASPSTVFSALYGGKGTVASGPEGQLKVSVPPLSVQVWRANRPLPRSTAAPQPQLVLPSAADPVVGGRAEIRAAVPGNGFVQASFAWRPAGTTTWRSLGTDDNAPYRVFHDVSGMPAGSVVEYRVVTKDNAGHYAARSASAVVGTPAPVVDAGAPENDPPATQPGSVTVAGSLQSELGCPGDWQPDCAATHLTLDPASKIWKGTFELPAGNYEFKAALDNSWTVNYGAGAKRDGGNIVLSHPADGPVTFLFDPATHWVTTTSAQPVLVAIGSAQSELGCPADFSPDCLRPWLQDIDGDGTWTFSTALIPPGSYSATVSGAGTTVPQVDYTVEQGQVVRFSYTAGVLTVTTSAATGADLSTAQATWAGLLRVDWPLASAPGGERWHYRLHYGAAGSLGLDRTAVTGGSWLPLTRDASTGQLQLPSRAHLLPIARQIRAGQVAVAAYDDDGTLVAATGVREPCGGRARC